MQYLLDSFAWAASLLAAYPAAGSPDPVAYSFSVLDELDLGNSQWQVVCDLTRGRIHFRTAQSRRVRSVDLAAFDLSGCAAASALMLDINLDLEGDVAGRFEPYTEARNREFVRQALAPIDLGVPGPLAGAFTALWTAWLKNAVRGFTCAE